MPHIYSHNFFSLNRKEEKCEDVLTEQDYREHSAVLQTTGECPHNKVKRKSATPSTNQECPECGLALSDGEGLADHLRLAHAGMVARFQCSECEARLLSLQGCRKHYRTVVNSFLVCMHTFWWQLCIFMKKSYHSYYKLHCAHVIKYSIFFLLRNYSVNSFSQKLYSGIYITSPFFPGGGRGNKKNIAWKKWKRRKCGKRRPEKNGEKRRKKEREEKERVHQLSWQAFLYVIIWTENKAWMDGFITFQRYWRSKSPLGTGSH